MTIRVGIEALAVAVPRRYLTLEDLAVARGVAPAKFTAGLGAQEMAVADPGEDAVALAATAAARLLRAYAIDPRTIGMLVVGTETGVDHSKPVASYVHGLLELPTTMRTFDTQHACYGGTAAVMAASDWVASGHAEGRRALVICSDIARYGVGTAGEPTQGGGAVALLISDRPELLALDRGVHGVFTADVHDFWRPHGRRDALVDGHYSIECYLRALAGAYGMWRDTARARGVDQLARIAYHVPFCKMASKAHAHLQTIDPHVAGSFEEQVAPSLALASRIGNTYTASLYLGLASLLLAPAPLAGQRIGMFSYGSGSSAEFFSGVVGPHAQELVGRGGLRDLLAARTRVDVAGYEAIMARAADEPAPEAPVPGGFRYTGSVEHKRTYARG